MKQQKNLKKIIQMLNFFYGKSQQSKILLLLDEQDFTKKREAKSTTHWLCKKKAFP